MHRDDVIKIVKERLGAMGVPEHVTGVAKVPSQVKISILVGGQMVEVALRSGITRFELDEKLNALESKWIMREQRDLEEAIAAKP